MHSGDTAVLEPIKNDKTFGKCARDIEETVEEKYAKMREQAKQEYDIAVEQAKHNFEKAHSITKEELDEELDEAVELYNRAVKFAKTQFDSAGEAVEKGYFTVSGKAESIKERISDSIDDSKLKDSWDILKEKAGDAFEKAKKIVTKDN